MGPFSAYAYEPQRPWLFDQTILGLDPRLRILQGAVTADSSITAKAEKIKGPPPPKKIKEKEAFFVSPFINVYVYI